MEYYVTQDAHGSDANDGLTYGTAFRSIDHAIALCDNDDDQIWCLSKRAEFKDRKMYNIPDMTA